nr:response regulator [Ensifer adhaerens]
MIVEDEFLLAMDLVQALQAAGYEVAGPAPSVRLALETIAGVNPDAAVLDIQLTDGTSFPVARRLVELGLPFIFFTSFTRTAIPEDLAQVPHVSKLEPHSEVLEALSCALGEKAP